MLKGFIRRGFYSCGIEVHRFQPAVSDRARLAKLLRHHEITLVLDVGANVGQYGSLIRDLGYRGRIVSFEPLFAAHSRLVRRTRRDPLWAVADRMAIGSYDGEARLHVALNPVFSSVKQVSDTVLAADGRAGFVASETVRMARLDSVASGFLRPNDQVFLKLDVQGNEFDALQGAPELLKSLTGLQLESSLRESYEGEVLFREMLDRLESWGFQVFSIGSAFADPSSGRGLQVDMVFFRDRRL